MAAKVQETENKKASKARNREGERGQWWPCETTDTELRELQNEGMISAHWSFIRDTIVPKPGVGEVVMTKAWVERGLSLPCSEFFLSVLNTYGLQPHNICPNSYLLLSNFVTLCEGHLGIRPDIKLWQFFFRVKKETKDKAMLNCGSMTFMLRPGRMYPPHDSHESVRTGTPDGSMRRTCRPEIHDGLPKFNNEPPEELASWSFIPPLSLTPIRRRQRENLPLFLQLATLAEENLRTILRVPVSGDTAEEVPEDEEEEEEPRKAYATKFFKQLTEPEKWELEQDLLNAMLNNAWGKPDAGTSEIQDFKKGVGEFLDKLVCKQKRNADSETIKRQQKELNGLRKYMETAEHHWDLLAENIGLRKLIKRMDILPELVTDLQASSARGAAAMTLTMCLAHHPKMDLDRVSSGVPPTADVEKLLDAVSGYDTRIARKIRHEEFYDKVVLPADEPLEDELQKERDAEARPAESGSQYTWTSSKDAPEEEEPKTSAATSDEDEESDEDVSSPAEGAKGKDPEAMLLRPRRSENVYVLRDKTMHHFGPEGL
ncbi:hypothetical protein QYE76_009427 [Lolium multiflorum]|uniref:Transposase (putative) gypsy type domain-containing protein n=1 Tax=Lolium multiflorum TaxID=4521 RepID=A0AAD8TVA5_LOLMU|nr:hypothetical protein QYE76_009427 [Lolium multiflorum]